jgi:chemotaxis protein methyltransferase CheR
MDDQQFRQLLNHFQYSWSGYRKVRKGVKKRINRHMHQLECRNMDAYLAKLDQSRETRQACELLLTVSISRFFRDRQFWHTLEKKLLPELLQSRAGKVKVWSAGCACGDEVYSFKIVWEGLKKFYDNLPKLEVLATDINPVYLKRARAGVYSAGSLKEIRPELISKYFHRQRSKNQYTIKTALAKDVAWEIHYLLLDPPGSNFDVVFLRNNVLTYYEDRLKRNAFENVLKSLAPSGLLIVGSHEALPFKTPGLVPVAPHPFVYKKDSSQI